MSYPVDYAFECWVENRFPGYLGMFRRGTDFTLEDLREAFEEGWENGR